VLEAGQSAGCCAGEGVVYGGSETRPELDSLVGGGVGKGRGGCEREDADELGLRVVREVNMRGRGDVEEVGGW